MLLSFIDLLLSVSDTYICLMPLLELSFGNLKDERKITAMLGVVCRFRDVNDYRWDIISETKGHYQSM
jgi:hypothetical protein